MTGNQINYQRFLEDQRHNYVVEAHQARQIAEVERHNVVQESQGWKSLLETERHNKAGESLGWANLSETTRANKAREALGWAGHYETVRSNQAREALGWAGHYETVRHNQAGEAYNLSYLNELARHNRAGEQVQYYNAVTGRSSMYLNHQVSMQNANTAYLRYLEEHRHNYANESIAYGQNPLALMFNYDWFVDSSGKPMESVKGKFNDFLDWAKGWLSNDSGGSRGWWDNLLPHQPKQKEA